MQILPGPRSSSLLWPSHARTPQSRQLSLSNKSGTVRLVSNNLYRVNANYCIIFMLEHPKYTLKSIWVSFAASALSGFDSRQSGNLYRCTLKEKLLIKL